MLKINAEDYAIIYDTREQDIFIPQILCKNGIQTIRRKLDTGDYMIQYKDGYIPPVVVERKSCINELIGNLLDNRKDEQGLNRFQRELERSKAITGMVVSLLAKYDNLHIIAVDRKESASMVHKLLYYELREDLKKLEQGGNRYDRNMETS